MKREHYIKGARERRVTTTLHWALTGLLASSTLLSLMLVFEKQQDVKTIVVPFDRGDSFWVSNRAVSENYLARLGETVVVQFLTLTSSNLAHHQEAILQLAAPSHHAHLKKILQGQAARVKASQLSVNFYPQTVAVDVASLTVDVTGRQHRYTAGHELSSETVTYRVHFLQNYGQLFVTGIDVPEDKKEKKS